MSDTLKTNLGQSDVDADANNFPAQEQSSVDIDADSYPVQEPSNGDGYSVQPLFLDEEEDGTLIAPPHRRRRMWLIVVSVLLLLVLIGGGVFFYIQRTSSSQVQYTTVPVSVGNLTQTVSASGPLQAKTEYDLNFSIAGQVAVIDVHVGEQVKAGQVLAEVNAPNLELA